MKTIVRATLTVVVGVLLVLVAAVGPAQAQDYTPNRPAPLVYFGPFSGASQPGFDDEVLSANARAFLPVSASASAPTGTGGTGGDLALTGSEATTMAAAGMGLVLLGGAAILVARNKAD